MLILRFRPPTTPILTKAVSMAVCLLALTPVLAPSLQGASTGTTNLLTPQGAGTTTAQGEFITAAAGLDVPYEYFVEVPPGLGQLVVEFFDADVGAGGGAEAAAGRDRARGGFNTSVVYRVFDPSGALQAQSVALNTNCGFCDNAWVGFAPFSNPAAGHWRVEIDLSTAVTGGNDIHAVGLRAHDGNAGGGGTELPVYYFSHNAFGVNPGFVRNYPYHPYITAGCQAFSNDFDFDGGGSLTYTSRTGAFNQAFGVSGNNVWVSNSFGGWTSDQVASDYGVWTATFQVTTAGGAGNYGQVYVGDFQSAPPPPGGNPEPDTFRVYLPTDGGGTPVKTYTEQLLTHISGPNPPTPGQTTRFGVTVRVVNPTPQPITFSTPTNVLTTTVPGAQADGTVTYAGGAQVSSGTVVSQPAVGASGTLTWNPGTVAAGATEILAYAVDMTPSTTPFDLAATGTPASGGTTAAYLDRATAPFTFGPLCELRVQDDQLTQATVTGVERVTGPAGPRLRWRTASEAGTAAFRLLGEGSDALKPLHDGWLEALWSAPQGGVYEIPEPPGRAPGNGALWVEELEVTGRIVRHGPFLATASADAPVGRDSVGLSMPDDYRKAPRQPAPERSARAAADDAPTPDAHLASRRPRAARGGVILETTRRGLHRVALDALAQALGMTERALRPAVRSRQLSLTLQGEPVAWSTEADTLLFFAQGVEDVLGPGNPFTGRNAYRLTLGRRGGPRSEATMEVQRGRPPRPGEADGTFPATMHIEENILPLVALPLDPDGDFWFWEGLNASRAGAERADFTLPLDALAATGSVRLALDLQGASVTGHRVELHHDGQLLGETAWQGIAAQRLVVTVDLAGLTTSSTDGGETSNVPVEVVALQDDPSGLPSQVFVDGFEVTYPRLFQANGEALEVIRDAVDLEAGGGITVGGLPSSQALVLEVTEPRRPVILQTTVAPDAGVAAGSFQVTFEAPRKGGSGSADGRRFWITTVEEAFEVAALRPAADSGDGGRLLTELTLTGADALVIAPATLATGAEELAALQRRRGVDSRVVPLEALLDRFAGGLADPRAVRRFLDDAVAHWPRPPRFVTLVGDGHLDGRGRLGVGGNLFPPLLARTPQGLFAADGRFADFDDDGVPELAIGRVPVTDAGQLTSYLEALENRLRARTEARPWLHRVLLAADDPDGGGDFPADARALADLLHPAGTGGSGVLQLVDLAASPPAVARTTVLEALGQGVGLFTWVGHGGIDRMAGEGLLVNGDVAPLGLERQPPVILALTCTLGRFEVPGFPSLGETLVTDGAAAVWAPSGLSVGSEAGLLGDRLLRAAFHTPAATGEPPALGETTRRALERAKQVGATPAMLAVYNLLGDPTLPWPAPPVPEPGEPGGEGE